MKLSSIEESVFDVGGYDEEENIIHCTRNHEEDAFFYLHALKIKNENTNYVYEDIENLSISMCDIGGHMCLSFFIDKHFNPNNKFNKKRDDEHFDFHNKDNGYCGGFIFNFFTLDEFNELLNDIKVFYNSIKEIKTKEEIKKLEKTFSPYLIDNVFYNGLYSFDLILKFYENFIRYADDIINNKEQVDVLAFCEP